MENSSSYTANFSWNDFELTDENKMIYHMLHQCMEKRKLYQEKSLQKNVETYNTQYEDYAYDSSGVYYLIQQSQKVFFAPSIGDYYKDSEFIINTAHHGPTKSLCFRRLENLRHNFLMYANLTQEREKKEQKLYSKKDFYKVVKIDTHVHHSACMNSKHLLNFIKNKLILYPDEIVYEDECKKYTLKEIFDNLNMSKDSFCIESLDTHAHTDSFHRFDRFNAKYNPYGQPVLREIFLKYDNFIGGKYLSEITKEVFAMLEDNKYHYSEYRISIYGKSITEWNALSNWVITNNIKSKHVKWLIQIPRLFSTYLGKTKIENFGDLLQNIFKPLFEVTKDPDSNPVLAKFLESVVGFDCVDDESLKERRYHKKFPLPNDWSHKENPPFSYYIYFLYANISSLNHYRKSKNLNTFSFRPHAGETGDFEHLAYTFLTAQSISHGVQLRKSFALQYLYYLCQIGIAMSPLSNNSLFVPLENNPFQAFFQKGLRVSLSTDDPLQFHFTKEPLMEEYSVMTQICKLSSSDQCELAMNSVLQSNFDADDKKDWIGDNFYIKFSNDISKTNVPNLRIKYRKLMWTNECNLVVNGFYE